MNQSMDRLVTVDPLLTFCQTCIHPTLRLQKARMMKQNYVDSDGSLFSMTHIGTWFYVPAKS